jgi:uncharacterized membrane protein YqiK
MCHMYVYLIKLRWLLCFFLVQSIRIGIASAFDASIDDAIFTSWGMVGISGLIGVATIVIVLWLGMVRIDENEVGIVRRKHGHSRPIGREIALDGKKERGWQAKTLGPQVCFRYFPWLYEIRKEPILRISSDEIGLVEAKDGAPQPPGRRFGDIVPCDDFQDANAFLTNRGQRGKQAAILLPGSYRINSELFHVEIGSVSRIPQGYIGLVEAQDGEPRPNGHNFGSAVECNNFQKTQAFFAQGGQQGKQLPVLMSGSYHINTDLFRIHRVPHIEIGAEEVGLVEAKDGSPLPAGQNFGRVVECNDFQDAQAFFAHGGQKGKQLALLKPGPYQIHTDLFEIRKAPQIRVPPGEIALVLANDGAERPPGQILGRVVECNNFQDAQAFFTNGGQKGQQLAILAEGTYCINTELFTVITRTEATKKDYGIHPNALKAYTVAPNHVGIITTLYGNNRPPGEIAGPPIAGHNKFQDGQKFLDAGGHRGLQEEILEEGVWHLNPWFVQVEQVPVTVIEAGTVGVVISHVGKESVFDGQADAHEELRLVEPGYKGIAHLPLMPQKCSMNTKVKDVLIVPTNEITLNW